MDKYLTKKHESNGSLLIEPLYDPCLNIGLIKSLNLEPLRTLDLPLRAILVAELTDWMNSF